VHERRKEGKKERKKEKHVWWIRGEDRREPAKG